MTTRRRFAADFKAKVSLEALPGDRTFQEERGGADTGIHLKRRCQSVQLKWDRLYPRHAQTLGPAKTLSLNPNFLDRL